MTADPGSGADLMQRLDRMAEISESPAHLTRRCYTPEHRRINDLVAGWMRAAGMQTREDAAGNLIGRYEGRRPGAPALLLGSHLDTVVRAGRYDGALGVVAGIDCVRALQARGRRLDTAIEVIGFVDEEGVRFQSTYLGSRAVAGTLDAGLLARRDADGVTLADAMRRFGVDPDRLDRAARDPAELRAYLELHIEQGPVLEREGLAVAAVTAIAGAERMTARVTGAAGHAGTVPMAGRQDALAAAAAAVLAVEAVAAGRDGTVATVGQLAARPGAVNVIPGEASFSIDIRAASDADRRAAVAALSERFRAIAGERGVRIDVEPSHAADGVETAGWILAELLAAMAELGHRPFRLASGAGHDAAAMAAITDVGMLFLRCAGGISHSPDERITGADARAGAEVLLRAVERMGGERVDRIDS